MQVVLSGSNSFGCYGQFTTVKTAIATYSVLQNGCATVSTIYHIGHFGFVVGAAFIASGFGMSALRMCHDSFVSVFLVNNSVCSKDRKMRTAKQCCIKFKLI